MPFHIGRKIQSKTNAEPWQLWSVCRLPIYVNDGPDMNDVVREIAMHADIFSRELRRARLRFQHVNMVLIPETVL